jgi:predicted Zn-dependent protease
LAVAQLRDSVQKAPNNPVFQYHLGMAYWKTGNRDAAGRALQKALNESPSFPYSTIARATLDKIAKGSD